MNRLILLGNGFDLAHGLKTSYNDFLKWYLLKCFNAADQEGKYEDNMLIIEKKDSLANYKIPGICSVEEIIEHLYNEGFNLLTIDPLKIGFADGPSYSLPFKVTLRSLLLKRLLQQCSYLRWVDIEINFYVLLRMFTKGQHNVEEITKLNNSMSVMIRELSTYLLSLTKPVGIEDYKRIFWQQISQDEVVKNIRGNVTINKIMVLNFNYTNTAMCYVNLPTEINHIHGSIHDEKNPVIFGFGDELDEHYATLQNANDNTLLKYVKSFGYFKTDNYTDLIRFVQSGEYQVYVIGHSCGLSDRTMLHTVFEHKNCVSIRIFYHETADGWNNFETLTQEISRHFLDKEVMRERIVKFPHCTKMPQYDKN